MSAVDEDRNDYDDNMLICPITGNPCMHEYDQFCDDYGCARKSGIDVDGE